MCIHCLFYSAQSVTRNQKVAVNTVEESGFDQEKSVVKR